MTELREFLGKQFDAVYEKKKTIQKAIDDTVEYLEKPKDPEGEPCECHGEKTRRCEKCKDTICPCVDCWERMLRKCYAYTEFSQPPKEEMECCEWSREYGAEVTKIMGILRAWNDKGPNPKFHEDMQQKLRRLSIDI